jgi:hypothetical protein
LVESRSFFSFQCIVVPNLFVIPRFISLRLINPGYPGTNSFCFSIALDYPDKPGNDVWGRAMTFGAEE